MKEGLLVTSRPNSEAFIRVTARYASISRRKAGPMGTSSMENQQSVRGIEAQRAAAAEPCEK